MKLFKKGFMATPAVRVLIVVVLVVIIMIALIRAGLLPGQFAVSLAGSVGGNVVPQVGGLRFPIGADASGRTSAGYEMGGEGFMDANGRRRMENFENGDMRVVWYHRKNCPHCTSMKGEWEQFVKDMKGMHPTVMVVDYDGDTEEGRKNFPDDISGVPTIRVMKGGKSMDYEGDRTAKGMMDFVHKNL